MSYDFIKIPLVHSKEIYRTGRRKSIEDRLALALLMFIYAIHDM